MADAPSCPLLSALWPLGLEAAQDELGCRLFCLEERNRHTIRGEQDLGVKKSHKEICLPPCKMAALKHLFGDDGGPGRRTQGCSGSVKCPELGGCGKQPWKPPQPFACSLWLAPESMVFPPRPVGRSPRQQPLATDPCLQTQPGGGVGPACARV